MMTERKWMFLYTAQKTTNVYIKQTFIHIMQTFIHIMQTFETWFIQNNKIFIHCLGIAELDTITQIQNNWVTKQR